MGLFNKLKGVFYDEVEVEDNVPISKPIESFSGISNEVRNEDPVKEDISELKLGQSFVDDNTTDLFKSERTFNFMELDEDEEELPPRRSTPVQEPVKREEPRFNNNGLGAFNNVASNTNYNNNSNMNYNNQSFSNPNQGYNNQSYNNQSQNYNNQSYNNQNYGITLNSDYNPYERISNPNRVQQNVPVRDNSFGGTPRFNESVNVPQQKIFKPTPVISPIYGILDKDYKKDEIPVKKNNLVKETNESMSAKITSFDNVRRKAYGTLEDDLNDTLNTAVNKLTSVEITKTEDNLEDNMEELNEKTQKIEDLISRIEEETDEIDRTMSIGELEDTAELRNQQAELLGQKIIEEDDSEDLNMVGGVNDDKTISDCTLEHDLFNLIDSMYDDKEE